MEPKKYITVTWRNQTQSLSTKGITLLESLSIDWDTCTLNHICFCGECTLTLLRELQTTDEWKILTTLSGKKQFYCLYNLAEYLGWTRISILMEICAPRYGI